MPKLSIIVPVYNVESYLEKCLLSVLAQTFTDFELILIDDGSTDRSGEICDRIAEQDTRIKVVHQQNAGVAAVRNHALQLVQGEYIGFVDSDDWIMPTMYEILYQRIVEQEAELAICEYFQDEQPVTPEQVKVQVYTKEQTFDQLAKTHIRSVLWDKLFKRDFIQGLRFPDKHVHEDLDFIYQCFTKVEKVIYVNQPLYCHIKRSGSLMNSCIPADSLHQFVIYREAIAYFHQHFPANEPAIVKLFAEKTFAFCKRVLNSNHSQTEQNQFLQRLQPFVREQLPLLRNNQQLTRNQKILLFLFSKNIFLFRVIYHKI